jgi:hypothetical protein
LADPARFERATFAFGGHSAGSVTSRYVHHLDSVLISAADRVAAAIQEMMIEDKNEE